MDSSEVCRLLNFLALVYVLIRHTFFWLSFLVKYATRTTEARKCSSVTIATAVRFQSCSGPSNSPILRLTRISHVLLGP